MAFENKEPKRYYSQGGQWYDVTTDQPGTPKVGDYKADDEGRWSQFTPTSLGLPDSPSNPASWDPNTPAPDYFPTPNGWEADKWGPFYGFQDKTQAYKTDQSKIPNIQDFVGAKNYSYSNAHTGPASFGTFGRPWDSDPEIAKEKQAIDQQYLSAVADYNKQYGTNIQPDQSQLGPKGALGQNQINWGDKGGFMAANPNQGDLATFLSGIGLVAGAGLGLNSAFGVNGLGTGASAAASAGSALPESYWSALADSGTVGSDAAAASAGTVGSEAGGALGEVSSLGEATGTILPAGAQASGAMTIPYVAGAPVIETAAGAGGLAELLKSLPPMPPSIPGSSSGPAQLPPLDGPSTNTAANAIANGTNNVGSTTVPGGALQRILNGTATAQDWLSTAGTVGTTALGMIGNSSTANSLQTIANQARADRAPALNSFNTALTNPDTWYQSAPAMGAADAITRKLSAEGNPANNPGLMAKGAAYSLGGYNDYLRTLSGPAFGTANTVASTATNAAGADNAWMSTLGQGLGDVLNPRQPSNNNLSDLLRSFQGYFSAS